MTGSELSMEQLSIQQFAVADLIPFAGNAKLHNAEQVTKIASSIKEYGFNNPVLIDDKKGVIAGHGRLLAAKKLGLKEIPCIVLAHLTEAQRKAYILADNRLSELGGGWDKNILKLALDELTELGVNIEDFNFDLVSLEELAEQNKRDARATLAERFGVPPFSVLNAREGWWQDRKRAWVTLGVQSEKGRGDNLTWLVGASQYQDKKKKVFKVSDDANPYSPKDTGIGTSLFDPVLCEILYSWFSPEGGLVLDPFAGGSVRGIVASHCDREYVGIDLRQEQIDSNNTQLNIAKKLKPKWICGDARDVATLCEGVEADMILSCPPYADLEVYSDDPKDLSTLEYPKFKEDYFEIIKKACGLLKENSFAVWVVGEVRDPKGHYYNFVGDTIKAFQDAGLVYYNEAILVTAVGSLPIRSGRMFESSRKVGKTHQNILVFKKEQEEFEANQQIKSSHKKILVFTKGDERKAAKRCGKVKATMDALTFEEQITPITDENTNS